VPHFDYQGDFGQNRLLQDSISTGNNMRVLHVREACSSLLTLRYYLRFLQDEYARDIGSSGVKRAMRTLMEVPQIMAVTASVQGVTPQMIRL